MKKIKKRERENMALNHLPYLFYRDNSGCFLYESTAIYYHWIELIERQVIGRREEHVDLLCTVPTSNLTQLVKTMWEDLGWKEVASMVSYSGYSGQVVVLIIKFISVMYHCKFYFLFYLFIYLFIYLFYFIFLFIFFFGLSFCS